MFLNLVLTSVRLPSFRDACYVMQDDRSVAANAAAGQTPVDAPPAPVEAAAESIAPDTPERIEKFFGMLAFGMGAELFPFLCVVEAHAMRLVCQRFHVAVDRRVWPVRDTKAIASCARYPSA